MLPCNPGEHSAYQDTFVSELLKFYPDPFVLPKSTWTYIVQFWYLDLSLTDSFMLDCYSVFGPAPRLPSCMLRSYLLALKLKSDFHIRSDAVCSGKLLFTPFSAVSPPVTPPAWVFFMTFFENHGESQGRKVRVKVSWGGRKATLTEDIAPQSRYDG